MHSQTLKNCILNSIWFFLLSVCVCVKRKNECEWCTRYKWLLSCRYFSLAKRYNIIIMIVRICETNVSNDKLVVDFFTSPSLNKCVCASLILVDINTKKYFIPQTKRIQKASIVHGTCQAITTITSSITPKWMNRRLIQFFFLNSALFQSVFAGNVSTAQKCLKQNIFMHSWTEESGTRKKITLAFS